MIVFTNKRYRLDYGVEIEKYIPPYCGTYPDNEIINLLKQLSTKSLIIAYGHAKERRLTNNFYRNLTHHLFVLLEKRNQMINGTLIFNFEDDSHLEQAPEYSI